MCLCARFIPSSCHPRCVFDRPLVVGPRSGLLLFLSVVHFFSSTFYLYSARHSISNVDNAEETAVLAHNEEYCMAIFHPLTRSMGLYARCPGLVQRPSIFLWLKRVTSIATPMFLRTWGKDPHRAIMQLFVWLFTNRLFEDTRANAFRVGCPNIPFAVQS